jgi:anaerobic selenocysteine-containing dehydrogenase
VDNLGKDGGVYLTPYAPVKETLEHHSADNDQIRTLTERMYNGEVAVLFVHGVNPLYELPASLRFADALENVPLVISFASFPDETAMQADYILPDHTPLESWGYQRVFTGTDRATLSGGQPVVVPLYDTRATADVLLAAVQAIGGRLAEQLPYKNEVEFLQEAVAGLLRQKGFYGAPEIKTFWARWQQFGGWWKAQPGLETPVASDVLAQPLNLGLPQAAGEEQGFEFSLLPFPSPNLGDGSGANRPWLQETPDPMTTVMWNSWVEINPETAHELGLQDDDVVRIISPVGELEVSVYLYPAIHPRVIAVPFGQGHTALGRYAQGRGCNPFDLLVFQLNGAGDLAFSDTRVKIVKTGQRRQLSRYESRVGVYGEHA